MNEGPEIDIDRNYASKHGEATSNLVEVLIEEMMNLQQQTLSAALESEEVEDSESKPEKSYPD